MAGFGASVVEEQELPLRIELGGKVGVGVTRCAGRQIELTASAKAVPAREKVALFIVGRGPAPRLELRPHLGHPVRNRIVFRITDGRANASDFGHSCQSPLARVPGQRRISYTGN